ncbi:sensor histidine kinase [Clostridium oryzae]|uniref:histidine kinase n=1 Tax=Clostridium oryzae TaxID=1450648 RepID=A0A1V4ILD0_9CLOT|nr:HAMP domain-containing sensor histidine kinase [Clostridium oryzae]OPJ60842.1 sensor kinase CusS [Clostridium oryzae]
MTRYFLNPELKRSSLIIAASMLIFTAAIFVLLSISYDNIKDSYIRNNMALVGGIVDKHPELKDEIIPLITQKQTSSNIAKGKRILKDFDYDQSLNISLIQGINSDYNFIRISCIIILLTLGIVIVIFNYINHVNMYKKIRKLIVASENIANFNYKIDIYEEKEEGLFSRLAVSFSNMRQIVKNNYEQVNKEKNFLVNILSDISHQLKTPISSLIIYNDILLNRKVSEADRVKFLENSGNQLNRIEWLVKSLLQLAKLDAGVIKFQRINSDLTETVQAAVASLGARAEEAKVNLVFNGIGKPIMMKHDTNWMCEALINIIKNAIEHTSAFGRVTVILEKTHVCARIIIEDNGEGIEKEELPHIFQRFYKGKENKNSESVGIGLALAKSIVESHEGIVSVESCKGQGTKFSVVFLG